ncbi:MAG: ATPase domain-containing protein [Actinomycetota bacterium]|nr:ATPase domain-containing protein [Actinomycetota bacterium]
MDNRLKTGINMLDRMLGGGLYEGASCMIKGAPGTGKTTLALQFLAHGIENGEAGLYVTFEEFSASLYRDARSIGIDLEKYEKEGKLKMIFTTPEVFLSIARKPGGEFDESILKYDVKRAVVDAFNHLESIGEEPKRMRSLAYSMVNSFRRHKVTSMLLQEDRLFLGDVGGLEFGLPYIVETIIQLKYVELESRVRKALLVLKHRASEHSNEILEYKITNRGYEIGSQYEADHVISGSAVRRAPVEGLVNYLKDFGPSMDVSIRLIEDTLIKMGQSFPEEHYPSKEAFFEAIKSGEAAISKLESQPIPLGDDIYGTASCPFRDTVRQLSDENNEAFIALTEKHRTLYPDAAVVHPFCVCHQNVRKIILDKTFINGSHLKSQTILCKSSALDKTAFDSRALDDVGLDKDAALELLQANTCLYKLELDEELE